MTAQQSPRKEGGEIHKDLPQQGGHFLQGALQFRRDTTGGKKMKDRDRKKYSS